MPWTASEFKSRHWHDASPAQAKEAAKIASAMHNSGVEDKIAIATAIKRAKRKPHEKLYGEKK